MDSRLLGLLFVTLVIGQRIVIVNANGHKIVGVNAVFGLPPPEGPGVMFSPVLFDPISACSPSSLTYTRNDAVIVKRGSCTFGQKAEITQTSGAGAVVVVNDEDSAFAMTSNSSWNPNNILALMVGSADFKYLQEAVDKKVSLSIHSYSPPGFDFSIIALFLMAVGTVFVGAYWSARPERALAAGVQVAPDRDIPPEEISYLGVAGAFCFIIVASIGLVTLFFFINFLIYLLIIMFVLSGGSALILCFAPLARKYLPSLDKEIALPLLGSTELIHFILMFPCYAFAIVWACLRNASFAWIMQDIMGIALLLVIQRTLRLPNIKVSAVLLSMAFLYDIFWVFISPYFFEESVMIRVATGGSSGEAIPLLLRFPRISDELGGYSLLGLGDIALPGLFISYLLRFDYSRHVRIFEGYFALSMVGYIAGVLATDLALLVFRSGQPALLYIVPSTLGLVCLVSKWRGDLAPMWVGGAAGHRLTDREDSAV